MAVVTLVGFFGCLGVAFVRLLFLVTLVVLVGLRLALVRLVRGENIRRRWNCTCAVLATSAALAFATPLRTLQLALERFAR
jgi:hypothetical protein